MSIQPISSILPAASIASPQSSTQGGNFASYLSQALDAVNNAATGSEQQGVALAAGTAPNIADVMIAGTQAQLAIDLTVQVRDRVVQAYNQIMNMQV